MGLAERLRRLDDAVVGPRPSRPQQAPGWVVAARVATLLWLQLLVFAARYRSVGWLVTALVEGALTVPAFVAAVRWERGRGAPGTPRRVTLAVSFLIVIAAAIITAAAVAPAPGARSQMHFPGGCHPASTKVVSSIARSIHGDVRIEWAVVVASKDAAVASALVSGNVDIGGRTVSLDRQPADYVVKPPALAPNNDLAIRISPSIPALLVGGPIGSAYDQVNNDRVEAENCALNGHGR